MTVVLTRRSLIAGLMTSVAGAALADAPLVSLRPLSRAQGGLEPVTPKSLAEVVAGAQLNGPVGVVVVDTVTGSVLEEEGGDLALPPASVAKTITAIYALEALGATFRFETRIIATGPVVDGIVQGDLVLAGGGDPGLTTDHIAELAKSLRAAGVRDVTGAFRVWGGALPRLTQIDQRQQAHLGYNPAIGGLNLNFNRVHFEWTQSGSDYRVTMDARTDLYRPDVHVARMRVVQRDLPVYTYVDAGGVDDWTVAASALGEGGSRWLPVRYPALYAGDVFRTFALAEGVTLKDPVEAEALPEGEVVARHESQTLDIIVQEMLEYSTNITAEAIGLTATRARGMPVATLAESAAAMSGWAQDALGVALRFVDHSGLGDASRITAREMALALVVANGAGQLRPLLKNIVLLDGNGDALANPPATVVAKTGTLNFVSGLAGYVRTVGGADLAFAIFAAEPEARERALASEEEVPEGARPWNGRARRLQQDLLVRWGEAYPV